MEEKPWHLYHRIADPASARVRKAVVDFDCSAQVGFHNIDNGTRDHEYLKQVTGADMVPVLMVLQTTGMPKVFTGESQILDFLKSQLK